MLPALRPLSQAKETVGELFAIINQIGSIRVSYAGLVDVEHIMNAGGAHGPSRLSGLAVRD